MVTIVWAFQPLAQLDGRLGIVECDEELADELVERNLVQDPRIGALLLKPIQVEADAKAYSTRDLKASRKRGEA